MEPTIKQPTVEEMNKEAWITNTAKVCHEINRAYCEAIGDKSQLAWNAAPDWQRDSAKNGVKFLLANPDAGPGATHASWLAQKKSEGWVRGDVKDVEKKTHPCMVEFSELPVEQRAKDHLFIAAFKSIQSLIGIQS